MQADMRDVVQVVEPPQSSHGPENTGEQIDGIDGGWKKCSDSSSSEGAVQVPESCA
jgi:hypothetical protein